MVRSLHLIDIQTPRDMLRQLSLLVGPDEQVFCIGRPPQYLPPQLSPRQVRPHLALGHWAAWRLEFAPGHTAQSFMPGRCRPAGGLGRSPMTAMPLVLSLPCLPQRVN